MQRTCLRNRVLPDYTKGEECFNMVSHIAGGGLAIVALVLCVIRAAIEDIPFGVVSSCIYGISMIVLYTMSGIYHGLHDGMGKRVMQVLDHCTIYFLICGTYTPVLLCAVQKVSPAWAWGLFAGVCLIASAAITFTAIDLKKYAKLSMACYIGLGWCIVFAIKPLLQAIPLQGFLWLLSGGIAYTIGSVLYGIGKHHRYMHSIFHLFVVFGSVMQFIAIFFYVL